MPTDHATRYQQLLETQPELKKFDHTLKIAVALHDTGVKHDVILRQLNDGVSDFWIPMRKDHYPRRLSPSQESLFERAQTELLTKDLEVGHPWPSEHFNLGQDSIDEDNKMPRSLKYRKTLSTGSGPRPTIIQEVTTPSGDLYVLKRIRRRHTYEEELEEMKYIKGELSIMKKMRYVSLPHFVRLVASYTEINYVGLLLHPRAECHLGEFLDKSHQEPDVHLLSTFFGCIATALAYLHCNDSVRHKDIKPENILVKGTRVLLTDFGISLDFSATNITTTNEEKRRSLKYCAPEVAASEPRNSSSDIWSLGCVFLEMTAVLKGKKRKDIHNILARHGQPNFCHSRRGIEDAVEWLREENSQYEKPLGWIKEMIPWAAEKRITARALQDRIFHDGREYSGMCCFKKNLTEFDPPEQEPLRQQLPAMILPLTSDCTLHDVKAVACPGLAKNWISSSIVAKFNFTVHSSANMEYVEWKGKRLQSTKYVEVTWTLKDVNKTSKEDFMVVQGSVGFDMLVTPKSCEFLRGPATSVRAHN